MCTQAIDFYLDDKYAKEREALVALCRDKNSSNEEIMGYVWEAQSNVAICWLQDCTSDNL